MTDKTIVEPEVMGSHLSLAETTPAPTMSQEQISSSASKNEQKQSKKTMGASDTGEVDEPTSPSLRAIKPEQTQLQAEAHKERFVPGAPEVDIVTSAVQQPVAQKKTKIVQKPEQKKPDQKKIVQKKAVQKALPTPAFSKQDAASAQLLQERCRQLGLTLFLHGPTALRSVGFTSAIQGEGKTFVTLMMANALIQDTSAPVTLVECNWDHPSFHEYFPIAPTPGLAEWLRGECEEEEIRHSLGNNLTLIPAGDGRRDAVRLLQYVRQKGLLDLFSRADEVLVLDLPPIVASAYGPLAASIAEALVLVVRAGVTTDPLLAEAYTQIKDIPLQGVILNQVSSRIPRWIQQLM